MVTAPTGPPVYTVVGNIHPWLLQPFLGYRLSLDRFYVQGFSSVAVPTDERQVLGMFNDIGAGYWLYRASGSGFISAIIPTVEAHVTTPLNHRNVNDPITIPDFVALTAGVHIGLANRAMLTVGVVVPVTGRTCSPSRRRRSSISAIRRSEPRTQRSGVSGGALHRLLRCAACAARTCRSTQSLCRWRSTAPDVRIN